MRKLMVTIALGASIVAAPVLAQGVGGGFMQRDQTRQEAQQHADMLFQMLDANHDGVVTRSEAEQAASQFASRGGDNGTRSAGRMQRMIEGVFGTSQSITLQQFEAQALARFDAQDLNHDGVVTALERQQAREIRQAQGSAAVQPPAPAPAAPQAQPPRQ
jgi:EF hand